MKIASYAKSAKSARNMVDYISRDGDLELLHSQGSLIQSTAERADLLDEWSTFGPKRKDGRHALHLVLSAPKTANPENVKTAAEAWGQEVLAGDYEYVQVLHTDEDHPHVHFVIARTEDGPPLRFDRADLQAFRESWAEAGTRHGIPMVASSRAERGQTRRSLKQKDIHIRKREGYTRGDLQAAAEVLSGADPKGPQPWDEAMNRRMEKERAEYEKMAKALENHAASEGGNQNEIAFQAQLLRGQMTALGRVRTRRDIMQDVVESVKTTRPALSMTPEILAKAYAQSDERERRVKGPARADEIRGLVKQIQARRQSPSLPERSRGRERDDGPGLGD